MRTLPDKLPARHAGSLFWLLSDADQRASIQKLAASRMRPEQIASITRMTVRDVNRIIEART
jgi:hypothetical protein